MFVLLQRVCKYVRLGIMATKKMCFISMFLQRLYTHVRVVILEITHCVYACVLVKNLQTCKTGNFGKYILSFFCVVLEGMYTCKNFNFDEERLSYMFVLLQRICTYLRLGIFYVCVVVKAKSYYFYVCFVVNNMYTCKTWNFGKILFVYFFFGRGYLHM